MKRFIIFMAILFGLSLINIVPAFAEDLNLIANPGFEGKSLVNWSNFDSSRFERYNLIAHSGKYSLAFYPLKEGAGICIDMSNFVRPGFKYSFDVWFRNLNAGWGQVDILLQYSVQKSINQLIIGRADCNKEDWVQLPKEFLIPENADPSGLKLVIKTAWGQIAFLVDDLNLRPALWMNFLRLSPQSDPDVVFQLGPQVQERLKLAAEVNIVNHQNRSLRQYSQPLYVPSRNALPAGFYRFVASVSDLDKRRFEAERVCYFGSLEKLTGDLEQQVDTILTVSSLNRYKGWIKYLQFLVHSSQMQNGGTSDLTLQALFRLNQLIQNIKANPDLLDTLSGVQEWAYLSPVDDSGQPFKIAIPTGYDMSRSYPLVVVMHGYGGNHLEYSGGVRSNPDYFELDVLGRARGGGYVDLSEADVLAAIDYVQNNWRIDKLRIHITGASMGGGGTFRLLSRYPDRWASGRPVCGYGSDLPILNSLHVPVYSTHSQDDPSVPVLGSRAPLKRLMKAGGQVIIDETNGLQHAAWNYTEGNNRALQWMYHQVHPENRDIRMLEYTAVDREACGAYWLKIAEWGSIPGPAHFKATAGIDNQLYLSLQNIQALQVQITDSPLNRNKDLNISVNGNIFFTIKAPLADSLFICYNDGNWTAVTEIANQPGFVLHTPGSVHNLYHNEPLLIVYGTGGDQTAQQNMFQAAVAASKSANPMWVGDQGDIKEGVPNHQLLYGHLKIKADTAISEFDLQKYNLLLIGKASENRIIMKMQEQLPVHFDKEIICSDGLHLPADNSMLGLYFYNPLSPRKLIYWVAADSPAAYRPYNVLLQLQNNNPCGTDLLVIRDNPPLIIKARFFDSRWDWSDMYKNSALIPVRENTFGEVFQRMAEAIRIYTGSDFTLAQVQAPPDLPAGLPGITQWVDFAALDFLTPIAVLQMKGALIVKYQQSFNQSGTGLRFYPTVPQTINPDQTYQIALGASYFEIQQLINLQHYVPDSFQITDITMFEVMKRILFQ
jgi:predicted esterase